jgi:tRNA pseudouridine32 synthase/23S rRNA pseudouridine746 synthase
LITYFTEQQIQNIAPPERFTFPFFYEPHALSKIAAEDLQNYLQNEVTLNHNFGLQSELSEGAIGKMFGVLVIQDNEGRLGYLWAFSGKLAGTNDHKMFVPPVFDMLTEDSFFLRKVQLVNRLNREVEEVENTSEFIELKAQLGDIENASANEIDQKKELNRTRKQERKNYRETMRSLLSKEDYEKVEADLIKESIADKKGLMSLIADWNVKKNAILIQIEPYEKRIESAKKERKERSAALQQELFDAYEFLNIHNEKKSLGAIFSETVFGSPPAAAGECATPKLLQYAFIHGLKPLAMAEFWWGASPKSEVRKHQQFYPACTGKCEPILKHMLAGIELDPNPFLNNQGAGKKLEIVYEDESLVVVNKPESLLSVPGINIQDSVASRLKGMIKDAEPLIIHRLDMATSGLLVLAKTSEAHKHIQRQFLNRKVVKRYTAILSRVISQDEGEINFPLRGDLEDRPRQLVCFDFGKKSITRYKVIERTDTSTRIHFWPLTGRTHQLRMHAAHELGLNAPIVGDDLYGTSDKRLFLHAAYLEFTHPSTLKTMKFEVKEDF